MFKNLTNETFGQWLVLERLENHGRNARWLCRCSCGFEKPVFAAHLKNGRSTMCKTCSLKLHPVAKTTHGACKGGNQRPEYTSWLKMKGRCLNPKNDRFKDYGGRDIMIYPEWVKSFEAFFRHLGPMPRKGLTIDRILTNGHYVPGNVRWATQREQAQTRRTTRIVTVDGITDTFPNTARRLGFDRHEFHNAMYKRSAQQAADLIRSKRQMIVTYCNS
jgi:hypothetical protein